MRSTDPLLFDRISALVDGEVPAGDFAETMGELAHCDQAVQAWHTYHLIGDVMRSDALAPSTHELDFLERLENRLAQEPRRSAVVPTVTLPVASQGASANDASVRWKWVAGASFSALLAIVVAGGWQTLESGNTNVARSERVSPTVVIEQVAQVQEPEVMVRDPELDALIAAHQQLGGHSAFQMPSGFLRNATFTRSQR